MVKSLIAAAILPLAGCANIACNVTGKVADLSEGLGKVPVIRVVVFIPIVVVTLPFTIVCLDSQIP